MSLRGLVSSPSFPRWSPRGHPVGISLDRFGGGSRLIAQDRPRLFTRVPCITANNIADLPKRKWHGANSERARNHAPGTYPKHCPLRKHEARGLSSADLRNERKIVRNGEPLATK